MPSAFSERELPPTARLLSQVLTSLDPRGWRGENATEVVAKGIQSLRSSLFLAESLPLLWLQRPNEAGAADPPPPEALETTISRLQDLLERDAELIGRGVIPLSVLTPRDPIGHGARLLRILADGTSIATRRRRRIAKDFGREARGWLEELPPYYRRNFHYQTDGYLSERSAELYEHQVELLFRGGADAMRRMILAPMKAAFDGGDGRGLRFLELGSGTGSATRSVARAFPKAKITALDLSTPYTKYAQKQLHDFDHVELIQGDAAQLEFGEKRFDAVYSVFLFHELPLPVREQVLDEVRRVLKPGGFLGFVDSLQRGDDEPLDWALDFFPRDFHEPYYANYTKNPMERLMADAGFESIESGTGYLAKWISAKVPAASSEAQRPGDRGRPESAER